MEIRCDFLPSGDDRCSREATRLFHVIREYLPDGGMLNQELHLCDECIPLAKKLWKREHMEWKEKKSKKSKNEKTKK